MNLISDLNFFAELLKRAIYSANKQNSLKGMRSIHLQFNVITALRLKWLTRLRQYM